MKKFTVFLIIFVSIFCLKPGVKMNINTFVIDDLQDYLLPMINARIDNMTFNNYYKKIGAVEINITNAHFHIDPIDENYINVSWKNLSTQTAIIVNSISGNLSLNLSYKIWPFEDNIKVNGWISDMTIISTLKNGISKAGTPEIRVTAKLEIRNSMSKYEFLGKISAEILEIIEPIIKGFIDEEIDLHVNRDLYKWISDPINEILYSFPVDEKLYDNIFLNYELTSFPFYYDWSLVIPLSGYAYNLSQKYPPVIPPRDLPYYNNSNLHLIQYYFEEYLFNSILKVSHESSIFYTSYNYSIENFDLSLNCSTTSDPVFSISNTIIDQFNFSCTVNAVNQSDKNVTFFLVRGLSTQELNHELQENDLKFYLTDFSFSNISYIKPSEFNIDWFDKNLILIASYPFFMLNSTYLNHTLSIPKMNHTNYISLTTDVKSHYIGVYADVQFI